MYEHKSMQICLMKTRKLRNDYAVSTRPNAGVNEFKTL